MSNAWSMLSAGTLSLYDGAKLISAAALRRAQGSQRQIRGEPMPKGLPPKPRDDARGMPSVTQADVKAALGGLKSEPFWFGMAAFLGDAKSLTRIENALHQSLCLHADAGGWITKREHHVTLSRMSELMLFEVISARSRNDTYPGEKPPPPGSARVLCPECRGKGGVSSGAIHGRLTKRDRVRKIRVAYAKRFPSTVLTDKRKKRASQMLSELNAAISADISHPLTPCLLCGGAGTFLLTDLRRAQALGVNPTSWHRTWSSRYAQMIVTPQEWEERAIRHVRWKLTGIRSHAA